MSGELGLDIIYKIDQLFVESVRCLEDTIKLINKSEEATETVKSVILEKRESVISEVKQTINQLAKKLVALSGESALKESSEAAVSEAKEQRSDPEPTPTPATENDLYAELKALEDLLE